MRHILWTGMLLTIFTLIPVRTVHAGGIGKEIWVGAGAVWPDYHDREAMAVVRGGVGMVIARHVTLGVSAQADRDRWYYFADTSVIFPAMGLIEPYARFQIGRRDDVDDTAMVWSAGVRTGEDSIRIFIEGFGVFEPAENYGGCVGISF
jgi:hypothetical protein